MARVMTTIDTTEEDVVQNDEQGAFIDDCPDTQAKDASWGMWLLYALGYAALSACVLLGDRLLALPWVSGQRLLLALGDNGLHAAIGGLTWTLALLPYKEWRLSWQRLTVEFLGASLAASCIDLDHFVAAGSLRLKEATSLVHRPPLHGSTLWLLLWFSLLMLHWHCDTSTFHCAHHLAWMVFAAFASHHVRDALRRGLWIPPFGATPPLPFLLYTAILLILPIALPPLMRVSLTVPCIIPRDKS